LFTGARFTKLTLSRLFLLTLVLFCFLIILACSMFLQQYRDTWKQNLRSLESWNVVMKVLLSCKVNFHFELNIFNKTNIMTAIRFACIFKPKNINKVWQKYLAAINKHISGRYFLLFLWTCGRIFATNLKISLLLLPSVPRLMLKIRSYPNQHKMKCKPSDTEILPAVCKI